MELQVPTLMQAGTIKIILLKFLHTKSQHFPQKLD